MKNQKFTLKILIGGSIVVLAPKIFILLYHI